SARYRPAEGHALDAGLYAGRRRQYRTADILYDQQRTLVTTGETIDELRYFNENLRERWGDFLLGGLDYTRTFADRSTLTASALYEYTLLGGPTKNVSLAWPLNGDTLEYQRNDNTNPLDGVRLKLDWARPRGEHGREEVGYQYRYLNHTGDFVYEDVEPGTGRAVRNSAFSNRIRLRRRIHAVYAQHGDRLFDRLDYTAGLRFEWADRDLTTGDPARATDTTYRLLLRNLFPSAQLGWDVGRGYTLKTAYSRRIDRATTFMLNPFPEREHNETLEQGDAELRPELIDAVEAGAVKTFGASSVFLTGYYRHVADVVNRVNSLYPPGDTILNRIYTNAGTARAWGAEAGTQLQLTRNWKLYAGGNVYRYSIRGDLLGERINTAAVVYSVSANTTVRLLPTFSAQAGVNYLSSRITAQGEDGRFYTPDLTLRKTFLNEQWTVAFQWLNIDLGLLDTQEQRITTERPRFFTTTNYVYEVDMLQLSVSYHFHPARQRARLIDSEFGKEEF
ncbi:MAG: outer membrane beta-barrel family protein, partial [Catalinimonas sp.]